MRRTLSVLLTCVFLMSATPVCSAASDDLVLWWGFSGGPDGPAKDISGNGNDGIIYGDPQLGPGVTGTGLVFDGANDYIEAPSLRLLTDEPFRVGAWVKDGAAGEVIVSQRGQANWLAASRNNGYLMTELARLHPWGQPLSSTHSITDGGWHHVHAEWVNGQLTLRVNGQGVASASVPSVPVSNSEIVVGAGKRLQSDTFWSGTIDEVQVSGEEMFTPLPVSSLPVGHVIGAVSNSSMPGEGPENTVNGSGLDANGVHSTAPQDMWLSGPAMERSGWIQYEFDRVYSLDKMWVWNHNSTLLSLSGSGLRDVTVEFSADGFEWIALPTETEFARAPGAADYTHNTIVDFGGASAKYVRLTATSNWSFLGHGQFGLSEVRFFYIPTHAREPDPASGQTGVELNAVLAWEPARNAVSHDVYLSTDLEAVLNGSAPVKNVTESEYTTTAGELSYGQLYFWKVNEIADDGAAVEGSVWMFSTDFIVDDFESYTEVVGERIFDVWFDGLDNGTGAQVGYLEPPFMERTIVYRGAQSMPIEFDNSFAPFISEVNLPLSSLNWLEGGFDALVLNVHGDPGNCPEPLYVILQDSAGTVFAVEHPNPAIITVPRWVTWKISFGEFIEGGVDLSRVTELIIGIGDRENPGPPSCDPVIGALKLASSKKYRIWIDEIRLEEDETEYIFLKGTVRSALTGKGIAGAGLFVHLAGGGLESGVTPYWAGANGVYPWIPALKNHAITVKALGFQESTPTLEFFEADIYRDFVLMTDPPVQLSYPIYRFRSNSEPNRYYFASDGATERETLLYDNTRLDPDGWLYDGVAFCTLGPQTDPNLEVRRFVHATAHIPAYVFSEEQLPGNRDDWLDPTHLPETAFFAYPDDSQSGTTEVYRFWSETLTCHYYTIDQSEPNTWPNAADWDYKDSFYVPDCPLP